MSGVTVNDDSVLRRLRPSMQEQALDEESSAGRPSEAEELSCPCPPKLDTQELNDRRLLRAISKECNIDSTNSLVAAYNAMANGVERNVLFRWLRQYNTRNEESSRPHTVFEYAELAKIVPRTGQDKHLLRDFVRVLCHRLCECKGEFLHENVTKALLSSLTWVESSVYDEPGQLRNLAIDLMSSLPSRVELTGQNFSQYEATFLAIHQVFFLLHVIGRHRLLEDKKKQLRQAIKQKREEMESSRRHYPVRFYFDLIQQAVERLETEDAPSSIAQAGRTAISALHGGVHILHLLRDLACVDINPVAVKDAYKTCRDVIANRRVSEKQWYDLLQVLIAARLCALKAAEKIDLFTCAYGFVMEEEKKIEHKDDQNALRYGIIQEIRILANQASCEDVREMATTKLVELATNHAVLESWNYDSDLLIALLDAVHEIHLIAECKQRTTEALRKMNCCCREHARETVTMWLGDDTMEDKLQMQEQTNTDCKKELFISIGGKVGYLPITTIRDNVEELKKKYQHDNFAKVNSPLTLI